ncbi:MAG: bifunctional riboflavin kinase/FAD synthetase [SAR324 cluster bacterium]|jgi:riboflavin kinase/FMN adenylyltransferase|nr:bifunctional riboflavin kinase/FAD synthetase [SAR324 cluster bacterium]|tara:strand:+ start:1690 stop:2634 length:945 start_codon:yes stop_codon:yes gene_type:complete
MQVYRFQKKPADIPRAVVTIGNFDGIHLGHRALISAAVNEAHLQGCASALVTFNPHPQEIIHSQQSVSHICTSVHQLRLLEEQGLYEVHVIQFTSEMSQMRPEDFALQFLIKRFDLVKLVIGYDFRFGKHRAGDFKLLENLSQQFNFSLEEIAPVQQKGQTVSSSLIRQLIREFRFAEIPQYLGREYSIYGKVEKGEQRGKKLGFSTANIFPEVTLALAAGVYVTKIKLANKIYFGVTNAGNKPTFGNNTFTVETFIFDFEDDIYGEYLEVIPLHQLRPETKFLGMEDLKKQIMKDVKIAQKYLISNNFSSKNS